MNSFWPEEQPSPRPLRTPKLVNPTIFEVDGENAPLLTVIAFAIETIVESQDEDTYGKKSPEYAHLRKAAIEKDMDLAIDVAEKSLMNLRSYQNDRIFPYWLSYYMDANIILACLYCKNHKFEKAIESLDRGLIVTSGHDRGDLIEKIFQAMTSMLPISECSLAFDTKRVVIDLTYPVNRFANLDVFDFSEKIRDNPHPIIFSSAVAHWPALLKWTPSYLLSVSLGGRRLVPVEVGKSYTHNDWAPKLMPLKRFLYDFIFFPTPSAMTGYLAQFNLFDHFRGLQKDFAVPDYCYADIPGHQSLAKVLTNAWLGPAGTVSPLHNDPYHNILAQVIGYKYVRIYSPSQENKLYARTTEDGIGMNNTSAVNVGSPDQENFPLFNGACYSEALLGPGDVMYIPKGWWHYVKSMSVSWSVSFWF